MLNHFKDPKWIQAEILRLLSNSPGEDEWFKIKLLRDVLRDLGHEVPDAYVLVAWPELEVAPVIEEELKIWNPNPKDCNFLKILKISVD